jgi:hypothetical protein
MGKLEVSHSGQPLRKHRPRRPAQWIRTARRLQHGRKRAEILKMHVPKRNRGPPHDIMLPGCVLRQVRDSRYWDLSFT